VYENLEQKRYRAIEDMRIACEESIKECAEHHDDEWLKTFIHLYFNSKYARRGYQVEIDGVKQNYSLSTETEANEEAFEIVEKYIKVISKDASGSEVDNVKHLYGATLLCLRAHPENAALKLLLTYCIVFLGPGNNETLKANAINGYVEGFMSMYEKYKNDIWERIATYNSYLSNQIGEKDEFFRKQLIDNGMEVVQLLIHEKSFDAFTSNYIKDL
jgi:ATP-dependent DNA helicase RecQ